MTAPIGVCVVGRLHARSAAADGRRPEGLAAVSIASLIDGYEEQTVERGLSALAADPSVPVEQTESGRYRLTTERAGAAYWRQQLPAESWVVPDD